MTRGLKPPILMVGNVRSGTTLVQDLFGLCDGVATWFEPRTVWVYADPSRRHDRFDERDATPRVKTYIRKRFVRYQRAHGGSTVMEKTPSNILRLRYMHAVFPESRIVYVVRNPLPYLSSAEFRWRQAIHLPRVISRFLEAPKSQLHHYAGRLVVDHFRKRVLKRTHVSVWGVRYPGIYEDIGRLPAEDVIARQWAYCSEAIEGDIDAIGRARCLTIRYEDLTERPHEVFGPVLEHFGLGMTDRLDRALAEEVRRDRNDKWRRLDPAVLGRCLEVLGPEMRRHGYELPSLDYERLDERAVAAESKATEGEFGAGGGVGSG